MSLDVTTVKEALVEWDSLDTDSGLWPESTFVELARWWVGQNTIDVRWCEYHTAEMVNTRLQQCWDAESIYPCVIVDGLLVLPELDPTDHRALEDL